MQMTTLQRVVSTLLGGAMILHAATLFRSSADHSARTLLEWTIVAACLLAPLWLAWKKPSAEKYLRAEVTWLTALLYGGIFIALGLH
jgi:hypothetical protein